MVGIVAGQGLGLFNTSLGLLGDQGQLGVAGQGRSGEKVLVNAATGNLVVQQQDEWLVGIGPDVNILRSYNSLGNGTDDNGDNWRLGLSRRIYGLTGTVNANASAVKRVGEDGIETIYAFDLSRSAYVSKDGGGSFDTLSYNATTKQWTWTDGDTQTQEVYGVIDPTAAVLDARLSSVRDLDGNRIDLSYASTTSYLITSIATSSSSTTSGERVDIAYDVAAGKTSNILSMTTTYLEGGVGKTSKRVAYTYDSSYNRLSTVTVDLSPTDSSVIDGKTYVTTYTYDDAVTAGTKRLKTLTQTDGSVLEFSYDAGTFKINSVKETVGGVVRETKFNHSVAGTTKVTDALGQVTELTYDTSTYSGTNSKAGQLLSIKAPAVAGVSQITSFAYDANGNITGITDARGNVITYAYDANGNRIYDRDAQGNVVERLYGAANQLLSETVYTGLDTDGSGPLLASGGQTTRYVYDALNHLRFVLSPSGGVTEHVYNAAGQRTSTIDYTAGTFDLSSLASWSQDFAVDAAGLAPANAAFVVTGGALKAISTQQTTDTYPNIYGATLPMGTTWRAEFTTPATITTNMLTMGIDSGNWGAADYRRHRIQVSNGQFYTSTYAATVNYNRTLGTAKANTTYVLEIQTQADGSSELYLYELGKERSSGFSDVRNLGGWTSARLAIEAYSGTTAATPGTPGSTNFTLIDNLSAKLQPRVSDLTTWTATQAKSTWQRVDYSYNSRGQLDKQTTFASLDITTGAGITSDGTQSVTQYVYDQAGNLLKTIGGRGEVSVQGYDGLNRIVSQTDALLNQTTTVYFDAALKTSVTMANGLVVTSTYDKAGHLISVDRTDGTTPLGTTGYAYDKLGRLVMVTSPTGEKTFSLYDTASRKIGEIDAIGALTEYAYNADNQLVQIRQWANKVLATVLDALTPDSTVGVLPSSLVVANPEQDRVNRNVYDKAGRLAMTIDAAGALVEHLYDGAGQQSETIAYASALNANQLAALAVATVDLASFQPGVITLTGPASTKTLKWGGSAWELSGEVSLSQLAPPSQVFRQSTPPKAGAVGDTWIDTGSNNLFYYSENLGFWTSFTFQSTTQADKVTSPDGQMSGDLLQETAGAGEHFVDRYQGYDGTGTHTFSNYFKAGGRNGYLSMKSTGNNHSAWFDLSTGSATVLTPGFGDTAGMEYVGNGWWRCWLTADVTNTDAAIQRIGLTGAGLTLYTGDGSSGVYSWGGQLEKSVGPGRYIATPNGPVSTLGINQSLVWNGKTWQPTNLLKWTDDLSRATSWSMVGGVNVTATNVLAPDGTNTASHLTFPGDGNVRADQVLPTVAASGQTYTYSVWLRGSGTCRIVVNTTTGIGGASERIIVLTSTWTRYTVTGTYLAGVTGNVRVHGVIVRPGDTARDVDVWHAQLVNQTGVPTASAIGDGWIDPGSTNLFDYSENLAYWTSFSAQSIVQVDKIVGPDGQMSGDFLKETTGSGEHFVDRYQGYDGPGTHTLSNYFKAGGRNGYLSMTSTGNNHSAWFNLSTGTATVVTSASGDTAGMEYVGNGWWRCWLTAYVTNTDSAIQRIGLTGAGQTSYTGDGTSGVYSWGAQLEKSGVLGRYISASSGPVSTIGINQALTWNGTSWQPKANKVYKQSEVPGTSAVGNLLNSADDLSLASTWSTVNGASVVASNALAPDGSNTASRVIFSSDVNARVDQSLPVAGVAGQTYTYAVWLRGSGTCRIAANTTSGVGGTGEQIITLTSTWTRYSVTVTYAAGVTGNVRVHGVIVRPGDTAREVEVWHAQLFNQPEVPVANAVGDVWIDTGSTNRFDYSENLNNWRHFVYQASSQADTAKAPDGQMTGDFLQETATSTGEHFFDRYQTYDGTGTHTLSNYFKAGGRNAVLGMYSTDNNHTAWFNLTTGVATLVNPASSDSAGIEYVGNGWWRCWLTANITNVAAPIQRIGLTISGATSYAGDGSSGVYSWGAQFEKSIAPGRYIPVPNASVSTVGINQTLIWDGTTWQSTTNKVFKQSMVPIASAVGDLWVDEGSTNLLKWSDDWSPTSAWSPVGAAAVANTRLPAPDGTNGASLLSFSSDANVRVDQTTPITAVAGQSYTYSVWLRGSGTCRIAVNTTTGVGGSGERVITLTSTWTRYSVSVTYAANVTGNVRVHGVIIRAGDTARSVEVWHAQLEPQGAAGLEIKTEGSAVSTRGSLRALRWNGSQWEVSGQGGQNRRTRNFYGADGQLTGSLDAENYYTANTYDAAGRLIKKTRYANAMVNPLADGGNPPSVVTVGMQGAYVLASPGKDQVTQYFYNARGQLTGLLDAENYYTTYNYDAAGNKVNETRSAKPILAWEVSQSLPNPTPTRANYALQSQSFASSGVWLPEVDGGNVAPDVRPDNLVAPDGSATAKRVVFSRTTTVGDDYSLFTQYFPQILAGTHTQSIWVKSSTGATQYLLLRGQGNNNTYKEFAIGAQWTRIQVTGTDLDRFQIGIRKNGGAQNPLTADVLLWGAQTEVGGSATEYIPTTTSIVTAAASTTNQVLQSQNFALTATWAPEIGGGNVAPDVKPDNFVAPDGSATAKRVVFSRTTTAGDDYSLFTQYFPKKLLGTITQSIWVKSSTGSTQYLLLRGQGNNDTYKEFAIGPQWTRIQVTGTDIDRFQIGIRKNVGTQNPLSVDVLLWGAQAEAANGASGYIPTTTQTVTVARLERSTTYTYDANQRLTRTVEQPTGLVTNLSYDSVGNLLKTVRSVGQTDERTEQKRYDKLGHVVGELTGEGSKALAALGGSPTQVQIDDIWAKHGLRHQYDNAGRRIATIEPNGTDAGGLKTVYYYDQASHLTHSINALGEVTQYNYNTFGQQIDQVRYGTRLASTSGLSGGLNTALGTAVTSIANAAKDSKNSQGYDLRGLVSSTIDALANKAAKLSYNAFGELVKTETFPDAISNTVALTRITAYDRRGQVREISESTTDGLSRKLASNVYDAFGRLTITDDARNGRRTFAYDRLGRQTQVIDPSSISRSSTYDAFGRVLTLTDGTGNTSTYTYDDPNLRFTLTTAEGIQTTTEQNFHGQTVKVTNGRGAVTQYTYDRDGQLTATSQSAPATTPLLTTGIAYDKAGRVYETTDGRGTVTRTTYDAANRVLTRAVDPSGLNLRTEYRYDAKGQAAWTKDATGVWTQTEYDLKGQVRAIVVDPKRGPDWVSGGDDNPSGLALRTEFTYDAVGHQLTVTEGAGSSTPKVTQYVYDVAGRRIKEIVDPNGLKLTTSYTFDANDNVVTKMDAQGNLVRYVYDAQNRMSVAIDATGAATEYVYDANGRLVRTRAYANPIAQNKGIKVWLDPTTNSSASRALGRFTAGDVVTVSVWAKSEDGGRATLFLGDAGGADPYDNCVEQRADATRQGDGWQLVTKTLTLTHDDDVWIFLYGDASPGHASGRYGVIYDDLKISSVVKGNVYLDDFTATTANNQQGGAYGLSGQAEIVPYARLDPAVLTDAQIFTALSAASDGNKDQITTYAYDKDGRQTHVTDAGGYVTRSEYDPASNVVKTTRYTTKVAQPTATSVNGSVVTYATPVPASNAADRIEQASYDAANRAVWRVDAQGYVAQLAYDGNGNVTLTRRYANVMQGTLGVNGVPTVTADNARDQVTSRVYDKADRLIREIQDPNDPAQPGAGHLNAVTSMAYDAVGRIILNTDAAGNSTRQVYDAAGRLTHVVDQSGAITKTDYDAAGRVVQISHHAGVVSADQALNVGYVAGQNNSSSMFLGTFNAGDVITATVLVKSDPDVLGGIYVGNSGSSDPQQHVDHVIGSVLGVRDAGNASGEGDGWQRLTVTLTMTGTRAVWVWLYGDSYIYANSSHKVLYDKLLVTKRVGTTDTTLLNDDFNAIGGYTILGTAEQNTYLNLGRPALSDAAIRSATTDANRDQRTYYEYDAAGRLVMEMRGAGTSVQSTTRYRLNNLGQRIGIIDPRGVEAAEGDSAWARATRLAMLGSETSLVPNSVDYNKVIDYNKVADVYTAWQEFDALGHVTRTVDPLGGITRTQYDAFGNAVKVTDPAGNSGYFLFNQLNQAAWHIDPMGYATQMEYDAFGGLSKTHKFDRTVNNIGLIKSTDIDVVVRSGATDSGATTYAYVYSKAFADQSDTVIEHDKLGRQTRITDAANAVESMAYDGLGNKTSYTNKLGGIYTYTHDRLGRVLTETAPEKVKQYNTDGSLKTNPADGTTLWSVVTEFAYDSRGNILKKTEARGLAEQRITAFRYDALNQQIEQRGESMSVYTAAAGETTQAPVETRRYDQRGNLIEVKAADGGRTLSYWDALDRKVAELSPVGTLTTWAYARDGKVVSMEVYGDAVALPAAAGGTPPPPVNAVNVRKTLYTYDANSRLTETVVKGVTSGSRNATTGVYEVTADIKTTRQYDKLGNVVKEVDGRGGETFSYYDKLGNKIMQVDAERYVTLWNFDGQGNVSTEKKYAVKLAGSFALSVASSPDVIDVTVRGNSNDRITTVLRDRMGRKLQESVANVVYADISASSGGLTDRNGTVTTKYEYNALGAVSKQTNALSQITDLTYDKQGRLIKTEAPTFADWEGTNVRPTTEVEYTGLGATLSLIERGKDNAVQSDDHITRYTYGKNGVQVSEIDAQGAIQSFKVDALGRITQKSLSRASADQAAAVTDTTDYVYDLQGRQVQQVVKSTPQGGSASTVQSSETRYNVYGDITAKGTNGGWQEFAEFDNAGRMVKSNAGTGVTKAYFYDQNGNATLTVDSAGADLRSVAIGQVLAQSGINLTISVYDKRNQLTDTYLPEISERADLLVTSQKATQQQGTQFSAGAVSLGSAAGLGATQGGSLPQTAGAVSVTRAMPVTAALSSTPILRLGRFVQGYNRTLTMTLPDTSAWGSGNIVIEVSCQPTGALTGYKGSFTLANGQTAASFAFSESVHDTNALAAEGVRVYSYTIYKQVAGAQNQVLGSFTGTGGATTIGSSSIQFSGQNPATARMVVLSRVLGSGSGWTVREVPASVIGLNKLPDRFTLDTSSWAQNSYEIRYFGFDSSNTVINAGQSSLTIGASTSSITQAAMTVGGLGRVYMDGSGFIHFMGQNILATTLKVSYRHAGTSEALSSVNLSPDVAGKAGWFVLPTGGLSGNYEYTIEAKNDAGLTVSSAGGTFTVGNANAVSDLTGASVQTVASIGVNGYAGINGVFAQKLVRTYQKSGKALADVVYGAGRLEVALPDSSAWGNGVVRVALSIGPTYTANPDYSTTPPTYNSTGTLVSNGVSKDTYVPNNNLSAIVDFVESGPGGVGYFFTEPQITVGFFKQTSGGEVYLGGYAGQSISTGTVTNPNNSVVLSSGFNLPVTQLSLRFRPTVPVASIAKFVLLSRPAGSASAAWDTTVLPPTADGAFALNWGPWPLGNYEYREVALDASGKVLQTGSGILALLSSGPSMSKVDDLIGGAGRVFMSTGGKLNFTEQGAAAQSLTLRYRAKGSANLWSLPVNLTPAVIGGSATPGWFQFDPAAYSLSGDFEYVITPKDSNGKVLNQLAGSFSSGNPNSMTELSGFKFSPVVARFTSQPVSANSVVLGYRPKNSTGAFTNVLLAKTGTGAFDWDTSSAYNVSASAEFEYRYESFDANGILVNKAHGLIRLGDGGQILSHLSDAAPTLLSFMPTEGSLGMLTATQLLLQYKITGSGGGMSSITLTRADLFSPFVWDASAVIAPGAAGSIDYSYSFKNAANSALYAPDGTLIVVNGTLAVGPASVANEVIWSVSGTALSDTFSIHKSQRLNAFGEVDQETDGRGNITDFSYSTMGKLLTKVDPQSVATLENGFKKTLRTTTAYTYDALGRVVGVKDANLNLNTQSYLAGGHDGQDLIQTEFHVDAGQKKSGYDIFGNVRSSTDEINRKTDYLYDKLDRLVRIDRPVRTDGKRAFDAYEYDAVGNRIAHSTSPDGIAMPRDKTYYDALGRIVKTVSAAAEARTTNITYTYDATILGVGGAVVGGWKKTVTDPNTGARLNAYDAVNTGLIQAAVDSTDVFGHLSKRTDMGGHQFTYNYNTAGWLTGQTSTAGQNIRFTYYANGYQKSIEDITSGALTEYAYDKDGNRVYEGYSRKVGSAAREYFQNASVTYDALNRITQIVDPTSDIRYEYDANGNRRRVWSYYHDGLDGTPQTQDYWYLYDTMNRFTVTMSAFEGSVATVESDQTRRIKGTGQQAVTINYDMASQRTVAIYAYDNHREDYTYTADGLLAKTFINFSGTTSAGSLRSSRVNDLMGRVTAYTEYAADGVTATSTRTSVYDNDGRLKSDVTDGTSTTYYLLGDGTVDRSESTTSGTTIKSYYSYEWWDSAQESTVTAQGYNPALGANNAQWKPGVSHRVYDANGHLKEAKDEVSNSSFRYITNAQGLVLKRDQMVGSTFNKRHSYYYIDGRSVGDVGNDGDARLDYAQQLAASKNVDKRSQYKNWKPIATADFDQNYQAISASYPGTTPGTYVARTGDTLYGVAQAVWGDSTLWYLIADANGLSINTSLRAGQSLTIPNKVTNFHNTSATGRVYDAGRAIGDTSPTLPDAPPPPAKKKGCGGLGMILMIVIAVVATVLTAGALAAPMASAASGLAGTFSAGLSALGSTVAGAGLAGTAAGTLGLAGFAVAGAVGSVASQLVGLATGTIDKFSWSGVAMGAIGGAAAAGAGSLVGNAFGGAGTLGNVVARSAVGNVITQGVSVAMGSQEKFDWRGVAASALSSAVGHGMSETLGGIGGNGFGGQLFRDTISRMANGAARSVVQGQRPNWGAIAAESFGSALGDAVVGSIARGDGDKGQAKQDALKSQELGLSRDQEDRLRTGQTVTDFGDPYADGDGDMAGSTGAVRRNGPARLILGDDGPLKSSKELEWEVFKAKAQGIISDHGAVGRPTRGVSSSGEIDASELYRQGLGDIRERVISSSDAILPTPSVDTSAQSSPVSVSSNPVGAPVEGPPLGSEAWDGLIDSWRWNSGGQSSLGLWDTQQRMNYHAANSAARDSAFARISQARAANDVNAAYEAARQASQQRIENRLATRQTLSKGGFRFSVAVDQSGSPEFYFKKYGVPGADPFDVAEKVARGAGSSSKAVNRLGNVSKVLGPIGVLYGSYSSATNIMNAAPGQRGYTIAQEAGTWIGGWQGASWGMVAGVSAAVALGATPVGWGIFAAGFAGGALGGMAGSNVGAWGAGEFYQGVTTAWRNK